MKAGEKGGVVSESGIERAFPGSHVELVFCVRRVGFDLFLRVLLLVVAFQQVQPRVSYIRNILRGIFLFLHVARAIPAVDHVQTRQQVEYRLSVILLLADLVLVELEDLEVGEGSELGEGLRRGDSVVPEAEEMQ